MNKDALRTFLIARYKGLAQRNPHMAVNLVGYVLDLCCAIMDESQVRRLYDQPLPEYKREGSNYTSLTPEDKAKFDRGLKRLEIWTGTYKGDNRD